MAKVAGSLVQTTQSPAALFITDPEWESSKSRNYLRFEVVRTRRQNIIAGLG